MKVDDPDSFDPARVACAILMEPDTVDADTLVAVFRCYAQAGITWLHPTSGALCHRVEVFDRRSAIEYLRRWYYSAEPYDPPPMEYPGDLDARDIESDEVPPERAQGGGE